MILGSDYWGANDSTHRIHSFEAIPAPRHQARQFLDGSWQEGQSGVHSGLRIGKAIPYQGGAYCLPGGKVFDRDGSLCLNKHAYGLWVESSWWFGVVRVCVVVLPAGLIAVAEHEGLKPNREVQEDHGEEDRINVWGFVPRLPCWVRSISELLQGVEVWRESWL